MSTVSTFHFEQNIREYEFPIFTYWENQFSMDTIDYIKAECSLLPLLQPATSNADGTRSYDDKRKGKISWVPNRDYYSTIYNTFAEVTRSLNSQFYQMDLDRQEAVQYTIYENEGDHFDYHMDTLFLNKITSMRKLTLIMFLSDPSEYEGGDFYLHTGEEMKIEQKKGKIIVFPSFFMHKVTPITSGKRHTLVNWFGGPKLK